MKAFLNSYIDQFLDWLDRKFGPGLRGEPRPAYVPVTDRPRYLRD